MRKSFIVYPKTQIPADNVVIVDAPVKDKLKAFISGYLEDYGDLPTTSHLQSVFNISKQDAEMALVIYGG